MGRRMAVVDGALRLSRSPCAIAGCAKGRRIPEIRPSPRIRRFDYEQVVSALKRRRQEDSDGRH